jgi:diamine N-acetyltransferase
MAFLENDTILLRALEPEDLDFLYKWENNSALWKYGSTLTPYSKFALKEYLSDSLHGIFYTRQLRLIIVERTGNQVIGMVDLYDFDPLNLRAGIGILLDDSYRNRGFGSQALQLIREYAFRFLHLKQLYAFVPKNNPASHRLFIKNGYEETGLLQSWLKTESGYTDVYFMQHQSPYPTD